MKKRMRSQTVDKQEYSSPVNSNLLNAISNKQKSSAPFLPTIVVNAADTT